MVLVTLLAAAAPARAQRSTPSDLTDDPTPRLRRGQARALVRSLPEVVAHARAVAPARLEVVALLDATDTTTCTGSFLECKWWFRVVDASPDARRTTWRYYGVDPYSGDVIRSSARRAMEVTSAPFVQVRRGASTSSPTSS